MSIVCAKCAKDVSAFNKRVWRANGFECLDCASTCEKCGRHLTQFEDGERCSSPLCS